VLHNVTVFFIVKKKKEKKCIRAKKIFHFTSCFYTSLDREAMSEFKVNVRTRSDEQDEYKRPELCKFST
jgi:hypothetical protein